MRVALTLAYNGTRFFGSQVQSETPDTVVGTLIHVLKQLNIHEIPIASGRTDRGVHATGQVCHLDLPEFWSDTKKLKRVLNEMLPHAIRVRSINKAADDFHARYSAKSRVYRYLIKEGECNPFGDDFITYLEKVDFEKLQKNIGLFEGEHDFRYFMKTGGGTTTTVRKVYKTRAYRHKGYIVLYFEANGFLRTQIRFMVAALLDADRFQIQELLACGKKHKLKPAPANGLYLAKIKY